jgi:GTPase SAR1 family protein
MPAMNSAPPKVDSLVFTQEETDFLKAVLSWQTPTPQEIEKRRRTALRDMTAPKLAMNNKPPVGEFRILVIGAKGTGKTSILTRVSGTGTRHRRCASLT